MDETKNEWKYERVNEQKKELMHECKEKKELMKEWKSK